MWWKQGPKKIPKQLGASNTTSVEIRLLSSNELPENDDGKKHYQITGAYYLVCRMTKVQQNTLFTYTKKANNNLSSQASISIYAASSVYAEGSAGTEALRNVVETSEEIPQKFLSAWHQAFKTKKRLARNYYLMLVEPGFIVATKDSLVDENV